MIHSADYLAFLSLDAVRYLAAAVNADQRQRVSAGEPIPLHAEQLRRLLAAAGRPSSADGQNRSGRGPTGDHLGSTTREAAERLGVSERTIRRKVQRGELTWTLRRTTKEPPDGP